MKQLIGPLAAALLVAGAGALIAAQGGSQENRREIDDRGGRDHIPDSSLSRVEDRGVNAHTNHSIRVRPTAVGLNPAGEIPASIRAVYQLPSFGGSGTIVIVDAFDYPTALADFNTFSQRFGLPTEPSTDARSSSNAVFQIMYANGRKPKSSCGWAQESALDIEWAHAMAPQAKIVLVEAASNSFSNLFDAVRSAGQLTGARQVSMSWGGNEFSGEASYDGYMAAPNVEYFAASGDTGGRTIYPGVSPRVVSAGGTRIVRDAAGYFLGETGWTGSGGGISMYEPRPPFQDVIFGLVGTRRGVPDMSFDADPASGVSVYDSTPCQGYSGWMVFGGTSVSSPALAGIVNLAGSASSTAAELSTIYAGVIDGGATIDTANFRDIVSGTAGTFSARAGWDFVTGVGSTLGLNGK